MPLETEPVKDWDFVLGSGGNAEEVATEDERRFLALFAAAFAAAPAAIAAFNDILGVVSTVFKRTSVNAPGDILIQKKYSRSL